ncbi:MAG TPA: hypothetical protein VLK58_04730 [Conexibacter sp.]|nr:hypothetical protein [Conexibacter sp.]
MSAQDDRRHRWFALAAVALLGAAVMLSVLDRPAKPERPPVATTTRLLELPPAPAAEPTPPRRSRPQRPAGRELRRAARRFLRGYLAHVYGRAPARRIEGAARALHRRLVQEGRDRPSRRAGRRGRVRSLTVGGFVPDAGAWQVTARIADGANVAYPVVLLVAERDGRLVVSAIGSAG